jgi:hypothetical protein
MHCVVRFGNYVCNEPLNKREYPQMMARIVAENGWCSMWDTTEIGSFITPTGDDILEATH